MNVPMRSIVPEGHYHIEPIAAGVSRVQLYPGGKEGPQGITGNDIPGGQAWSELILLGTQDDDFIMVVPDIRMPPNQYWPMHWHDCWTIVLILEGSCAVGDWNMVPGDVFVAAPSIEYGPLVIGPKGCRLLEIFSDLVLSAGGYGPEYQDHPTLAGTGRPCMERTGINTRNNGHSMLSLEGAEGIWKSRLRPGWSWDLGAPDDPDRCIVRDTRLVPGERMPACTRGDAYAAIVLDGSIEVGGKVLVKDEMLKVDRGGQVPEAIAGPEGVHLLENFRTTKAL